MLFVLGVLLALFANCGSSRAPDGLAEPAVIATDRCAGTTPEGYRIGYESTEYADGSWRIACDVVTPVGSAADLRWWTAEESARRGLDRMCWVQLASTPADAAEPSATYGFSCQTYSGSLGAFCSYVSNRGAWNWCFGPGYAWHDCPLIGQCERLP